MPNSRKGVVFAQQSNRWAVSGPLNRGRKRRLYAANAPLILAGALDEYRPALFLDVGVHDEGFFASTRRFHERLLDLEIPHVYRVTPDGHGWVPYIMEQIQWSVQVMRRQRSMEGLQESFPQSFEQYVVPAEVR